MSLLKKSLSSEAKSQPLPAYLNDEWELQVHPDQIFAVRVNTQGEKKVLVQWQGLPEFENSWEAVSVLQYSFPTFHLEDKVNLEGEVLIESLNPYIDPRKPWCTIERGRTHRYTKWGRGVSLIAELAQEERENRSERGDIS